MLPEYCVSFSEAKECMIGENPSVKENQVATLGGGCFWCMGVVFNEMNGVEKVVSGYSGGSLANPTYEQVCTGRTGHAEVVQISFDPKIISYKEIVQIFFTVHDPTTLNRQGDDIGTQYRSMIFYYNNEQRLIVQQVIEGINAAQIYDQPIVTQVEPFKAFYKAEDYHQEYFKKNPMQPYCRVVIAPKVAELRGHYLEKLKKR
jgi:peptide-methionine (S)-S-oxide reductase